MLERLRNQANFAKSMAESVNEENDTRRGIMQDSRAAVSNTAMNVVSLVVALTVGAIVAAFLLPIGIDELVAVDTSSWSSGATALWDILDVIVVLAVFLFFIAVALAAADRA